MDAIDSMEINKLKEIIMNQNQQIVFLKEQIILQKEQIKKLKKGNRNESKTKNADIFRVKNEYKRFTIQK
ncbi:hypothetical protein [Mycoplasmopsis adleri]|uniref:hypothetical protein n=1 Tax=Mycoplasmopsis adleri TaxID=51362 RepID=UPI00387342F1